MHKEFLGESGKKLIPIVFSHGLGMTSSFYTALFKDYASYGYIVIALNHQDESCVVTYNSNDKPIFYDGRF